MCSGRVPDLSGSNRKSSATDGGKSNRRHNQPTRSSRTQCPSTWNISSRGEHIFLSSVTNFPHAPIKLVLKTPANSNLAKPVFIARYSMSSIINKITQKNSEEKILPDHMDHTAALQFYGLGYIIAPTNTADENQIENFV